MIQEHDAEAKADKEHDEYLAKLEAGIKRDKDKRHLEIKNASLKRRALRKLISMESALSFESYSKPDDIQVVKKNPRQSRQLTRRVTKAASPDSGDS